MTIDFNRMLTVGEVAYCLHISPRTVYKSFKRLGGSYPAGRTLRFPPGLIREYMEGQDNAQVELFVHAPGREVRGEGLRNAPGRGGGKGQAPGRRKGFGGGKQQEDCNRHGI